MSRKHKGAPRAAHTQRAALAPTTRTASSVDDLLASSIAHQQAGRAADAEADLHTAIEIDASDTRAAQLLGVLLTERGDADAAVTVLEAATAGARDVAPENASVFNNLGNALRRAGRFGDAEEILLRVTAAAPGLWHGWHNLGQVYKQVQRLDEAAAAMRKAVALGPEFGPNHAVLAEILQKLGRFRAAAASARRALELGYQDPDVWTVLGNSYRQLGELEEAIRHLESAVELAENGPMAHSNLGITLAQAGDFERSLAHFDRCIELGGDDPLLRANRGYARLTAGDVLGGWEDWEYAIKGGPRGDERPIPVPRWTPDDRDVTVLAYREQGIGDEILFASCYPDLIAHAGDSGHVIIECEPRLVDLFARSFPEATVRRQSWDPLLGELLRNDPDCDRATPCGSLPLHFRRSADDFPTRRSFLRADAERVERWRTRLAAAGAAGPIIGISWRSRVQTAERRLEYTRLDEWGPVFETPGASFVNLQYDDCERDLRDAEARFGVPILRWDWLDLMNDFEEVAALTSCLDLVVAPRNAVAMLAGGLGISTVMMGNRWDWSDLGTDTSPWFPSIRLVYRHLGEDWDAVVQTAADQVAETVASANLAAAH